MRVLDILPWTTADGPGFRTSVYFAGCTVHCPGCHNPQSWDPEGGFEFDVATLAERIIGMGNDVTFSGGDPLLQSEELGRLAEVLKQAGKNIWCYTGRLYEEVAADPRFRQVLDNIDVLVDGPFIERLRDTTLLFCGSSNQRLIDIRASRAEGRPVIWHSDF